MVRAGRDAASVSGEVPRSADDLTKILDRLSIPSSPQKPTFGAGKDGECRADIAVPCLRCLEPSKITKDLLSPTGCSKRGVDFTPIRNAQTD